MAEEVEIGNVGGDGGVASEATLASLTRAIEKLAASTGKDPTKEAGKVQQQYNQAIKSGITASTKNRDALEKRTEATNKATTATNKYARALAGATMGALGAVTGGLQGMFNELSDGKTSLSDFAKHVPLVGGYLSVLTGIIDTNIENFRALSQVGASFGDGLNDIRATAAQAGMPLGDFVDLVSQNSEVMKLFGADTAAGARNFAAMSRELRQGPGKTLMNLGYTSGELNELLLDYADIQAGQFTRDRQQGRVTAQNAAEFGEELQKLTAVSGKRREQIMQELQQQQGDLRVRVATSQMTEEEAERFRLNIADVAGESTALSNALIDFQDGIPSDDTTRRLMQMSSTFDQFGADVQNMDPQQLNNFVVGVREDLEEYARANGMTVQELQNSIPGMAEAFGIIGETARRNQLSDEDYAAMLLRQQQEQENGEALKEFGETVQRLMADLTSAFISSGVLQLVQTEMENIIGLFQEFVQGEQFSNMLQTAADTVKQFIETWKNFDLKTAIFGDSSQGIEGLIPPDFFPSIGDLIGNGLRAALTSPTVLAGIAAIFVAPKLINALSSGFSGLFGGGRGGGSDSGGSRRGGGGAARAGGAIGGFLGNLGAGIMKGAAAGLKAFANPAILVGAGILGGSIVAIGAGIAGATWIMGQALPSLAEGLESFANIDGGNLVEVGLGIGAVGVALAAMGAGSAIAAAGTAIASVIEMIPGRGPLERLEEFSNVNIDAAKVKANAEAMAAYGAAMAVMGGGAALGSIGNAVSNLVDGIVGFFGGDTGLPYDEIRAFASANLGDPAAIQANSEAVTAFGNAMSSVPNIDGERTGGLFGAIASAFHGDIVYPWDKVKMFAEADLGDTTKLQANAESLRLFGDAMSTVPEINGERAGGLFGAIASAFHGDMTYPWDKVKLFAEADLGDAAKLQANATSLTAFGNAMSTVPEINAERSGGIFGAIGAIFGGGREYPWDSVKMFADADLGDPAAIQTNSAALQAFSAALGGATGLSSIQDFDPGDLDELPSILEDFSEIDGTGLANIASGMTAIASVEGLQNNLDILKQGLDIEGVRSYNTAMENLVETLSELNRVLAEDNEGGLLGGGSGVAASDVLGQINSSSAGSAEGMNRLNSLMSQVLAVLQEIATDADQIERNTASSSSNIAAGRVSVVR